MNQVTKPLLPIFILMYRAEWAGGNELPVSIVYNWRSYIFYADNPESADCLLRDSTIKSSFLKKIESLSELEHSWKIWQELRDCSLCGLMKHLPKSSQRKKTYDIISFRQFKKGIMENDQR